MAAATQQLPVSKLTCGFCGFVSPHFNADPANVWAPYYRSVYSLGRPDAASPAKPRLSGVGYHRHDQEENYVPAKAQERWDERNPHLSSKLDPSVDLIQIRDIKPPGPEISWHEQADYAWGFLFHEACWAVLEQAVKPDEIDIEVLWRILCSVPCGSELPNWGHNYGGLYMGTMRDQARGEHFVLLGRNSNLVIPSTFSNPFKVPDLERLVLGTRIKERDEASQQQDSAAGGGNESPVSPIGALGVKDAFAVLPMELKEMLMCYLRSADAANLRLASRSIASTPQTLHFFQSRFWPGREMAVFFDAFLLPESAMRGTDWQKLYWQLKIRIKYNRVCLGERNRLRLWSSTIRPLATAIEQIQAMSDLRGGPDWKWTAAGTNLEADWKICRTAKLQAPIVFGEIRRVVYRAEADLPSSPMAGVYVSFIGFFGSRYVTGLRFVFQEFEDIELGYILKKSEEYLPVYGSLGGFHCATDECGFRALALVTGRDLVTEYLSWAGSPGSLTIVSLESTAKMRLSRIRASFDGFRLQALLIPEK